MAGGSPAGASLVRRTLDVLSTFDTEHRALTLSEIAERSALAPATALRIVRELSAGGALERIPDGSYVIGRRLWDMGLLAPIQTSLRDAAAPFLQDLHAATRATVHLAARDGDRVLYLDRLSGNASVPVVSRVGGLLPLHATGVGKILLAYAPEDVVGRVLDDLTPHTPYTVVQPGVLLRQLKVVRETGVATTREEMSLGACSIAVPIWVNGAVAASLGVVVADDRRERQRLVTALAVAANGIGRTLTRKGHDRA